MSWPAVALISLSIFWLALLVLLTRWPRVRNRSISQHSAAFKETFYFFTAVQAIVGTVLYLFIIRWFIPHFHLSWLFTIVYTITAWLQILSAFIPDSVEGKKSALHQRLANPFALGMLIVIVLLALSPTIHGWPKLFVSLVALYMVIGVGIIVKKGGMPHKIQPHTIPNYLFLQVIYIVSFQAAILCIAFYK